MSASYLHFSELHRKNKPLLLGNVWNAQSARVYEKAGFDAIGTSSAAVAHSLGYEDGENMPFEDYLFIIKRILAATSLPVSVDMEAGFGKSAEAVVTHLQELYRLGVAGINIEDSVVSNGERTILDTEAFTHKLKSITDALNAENIRLFINVRCDAFLLNLPAALSEARLRIKRYETAAIDGLFLPGIAAEKDILDVAAATRLPLNVMCLPQLPDFGKLERMGVKRISMGNFVNNKVYGQMEELTHAIRQEQSFSSLF
ncbi:isocitrate lyase/PEP mutase family protein [Pontibacter arcticus]|uniref:Isocitrate lyase/phosphoenolpyruvate mutase family protein n=1 Tax=Pontibacter arcticus TaxID=2080288 RepID=A0A364RGZ7_9BACT|nr:isocitrate lyase/phosphoenolpyruvate mutase family protein [Pontibacter arcticus]RAU83610.1 isocitrate lyase/phosphoenolpyruvate mutase family protein [Pontibacter arcticus]